MSSIGDLPPETLLIVLSYLSYWDVAALELVSRVWRDFVMTNEETLFHQLSRFHGAIPGLRCSLEEASLHLPASMRRVSSWKLFFVQCFRNEVAWVGNGHTKVELSVFKTEFEQSRYPVHRFKIDEKENTVICTSMNGGLMVRDIDTRDFLFQLPRYCVRPYAHIEFSKGFVIFDREGDTVEVWRRYNDAFEDEEHQILSKPDDHQQLAHQRSQKRSVKGIELEYEQHRGELVPYAALHQPEPTRAYRFVFPTLLIASSSGEKAFLWDIPTSSLVQIIDISNPYGKMNHPIPVPVEGNFNTINYVEQSKKYIFVCTKRRLLVFARGPVNEGKSPLIYAFPDENVELEGSLLWCERTSYNEPIFSENFTTACYGRGDAYTNDQLKPFIDTHDNFVAAHVSEDGRDLVAISEHGCLYCIDNFERLFPKDSADASGSTYKEVVWYYQFRPSFIARPAYNLAFERGKIALTCGDGIFIFTLNRPNHIFTPHPLPPYNLQRDLINGMEPSKFISTQTLIHFTHSQALRFTSWSALSADSFWTTWHPIVWGDAFDDFAEATLVRVKML